MTKTMLKTMQAIAIDRFGGIETMALKTLPMPEIGDDEILIQIETAGVGVWDILEREGAFAKFSKAEPKFPYVIGSDGAGTVVAVGDHVDRFQVGDRVYAYCFLNPKGGCYAEYIAVNADNASHIPAQLSIAQAGAMPVAAITALCGLDNTLSLQQGETLMILGANGGIGHVAVQLAKRMGARVLAVASGDDGVALALRLGADAVVEGHTGDVAATVRQFAPSGLDTALITSGGKAIEKAMATIRDGGRVAFPHGVEPEPKARPGVIVNGYDGTPDQKVIAKLNQLIEAGPFQVHVARTFSLDQAVEAHRALGEHYLGKIALRLR